MSPWLYSMTVHLIVLGAIVAGIIFAIREAIRDRRR